jgi:hypothetical protein
LLSGKSETSRRHRKNVRFRPKADIKLAVRYWGNADIADMSECKAANIRRLN